MVTEYAAITLYLPYYPGALINHTLRYSIFPIIILLLYNNYYTHTVLEWAAQDASYPWTLCCST